MLDKITNLVLAGLALFLCSNMAFAKPNASTTGYSGQLTAYTGPNTITVDGTTLENVEFDGQITIQASNVTIRNCLSIVPRNGPLNNFRVSSGTNIVIEDCEMRGARNSAVFGSNFTVRRSHIWDMGADGFKPINNVVLEDNYVERLHYIPSAHADIIQMRVGDGLVVRGNNFECFLDVPPDWGCSIAIFITDSGGPTNDVLIENNWMDGGNFTLQVGDNGDDGGPTGLRIRNNFFGTGYRFGPATFDSVPLDQYCGNRWEISGQLLDGQSECSGGSPPAPQPQPQPQPQPEPEPSPPPETEAFVSPPTIEPLSGVFSAPVTATLSSTDGGTIYYTLDGSTPSSASLEYTGPLVVTNTTQIRSIVQVAGGSNSSESQATYVFGAFYADEDWTSISLTPGDDSYVVEAVITPDLPGIDFVIGLGDGPITSFDDAAALVRFAQAGQIDVRNGAAYQAERLIEYQPSQDHRVRIEVDLSAKTYSVWIESTEGSLVRLAKDFAFRAEQANVSEISTLGAISRFGPTGVTQLETFSVVPEETSFLLE